MSKTTKYLLILFTSILLPFTIYWFAPFISRNYSGGLKVTFSVFTKSPFLIYAKWNRFSSHLLNKGEDLDHSSAKLWSSRQPMYSPDHFIFSKDEEVKVQKNEEEVKVLKLVPSVKDSDTVSNFKYHQQYRRPVVFDEKDVVVLSDKNFSHFIANNRYVMVFFYAGWSYLSKKLAPEYAAAATMLKGEVSKVVLAKVDCTLENELTRKYKIQGYPWLYFFVGGVHLDEYYDDRTRDAIATWVKRKIPGVYNVTTTEEAENILAAGSTIVLGFLDTLEGPDSEELAAASKLQTDVNFYQASSPRVAKIFQIDPKIKPPALVILQNEAEVYSQFDGQFTRLAIADFVSINKLPLVITYNLETSPLVFKNPLKQLWLFASANDSELMSHFQEAAKAFKGKLLFVYVEIVYDVETPLHFRFDVNGVTQSTYFTIFHPQIYAYSTQAYVPNNKVLDGELTLCNIKSFGENFLETSLESHPIPNKVLKNGDRYAF